jgi:hypothetical protein
MRNVLMLILLLPIFSCKTDKEKVREANEVVETFVKQIELENYSSADEIYPGFSQMGKYWILYDFNITDSKVEGDKVIVYGKYKQYDKNNESIMFVLEPSENEGTYYITSTKGLSAFFGSNIYLFLRNIRCLEGLETDQQIAEECRKREPDFQQLIQNASNKVEGSVFMESNSVSSTFGFLMGNISVKNSFSLTIPSFSYDIYLVFYNSQGEEVFREKSSSNVYNIPSGGNISVIVNQPQKRNMAKIGIEFRLTKTDWLESYLVENLSGEINCNKFRNDINKL